MTTGTLTFEVDREDLAAIERKLRDRRTKVGRTLRIGADPILHFTNYLGTNVVREARTQAPRGVTGRLRRGLELTFVAGHAEVVSKARHSLWVHQGTRPHWPPPGALAAWAASKGIPEFLVARAIARRGTRANPFLARAWNIVMRRDVAPSLRRLARNIEIRWGRR